MKNYTILMGLIAFACFACEAMGQNTKSETFNMANALILRDGKRIGLGTVVTNSRGMYLVTARHLFQTKAYYTANYEREGRQVYFNIKALQGDEENDTIVGIFAPAPVLLEPSPCKLEKNIEAMVNNKDGFMFEMKVLKRQETFLGDNSKYISIGYLEKFGGQLIECIDTWFGHGSSGGAFIDEKRQDRIWTVFGEWPPTMVDGLRDYSATPFLSKGFTMVTGATWTDIERWVRELRSKQ